MTRIHDRNEQVGKHMIHEKNRQQRSSPSMHAQREDLQQATQHLMRSLFRTGVSLALFPVNRLPHTPQQHFFAAGRELTQGVATLIHELADGLEGMAKDSTTSTFKQDPLRDEKLD